MERKEISRGMWKGIVWTPIILGGLIWSIFYWLIQSHLVGNKLLVGILMTGTMGGGMLVSWGFGLVYARYFKIEGIDN